MRMLRPCFPTKWRTTHTHNWWGIGIYPTTFEWFHPFDGQDSFIRPPSQGGFKVGRQQPCCRFHSICQMFASSGCRQHPPRNRYPGGSRWPCDPRSADGRHVDPSAEGHSPQSGHRTCSICRIYRGSVFAGPFRNNGSHTVVCGPVLWQMFVAACGSCCDVFAFQVDSLCLA